MYASLTFSERDTKARIAMSGPSYVSVGDDNTGNKVNLLCHVEVVRRMAVVCGLIQPAPVEVPDAALSEVGVQLAAELVKGGGVMERWNYKIDVHQYLDTVLDEREPIPDRIRNGVLSELAKLPRSMCLDTELSSIIDDIECAESVGDFDNALSNLYDYADNERIWMGK